MLPTLKPGQIILVNRLSYLVKKPKIKDIVVFRKNNDNHYLVKRIIDIKDEKYFMSGDNKKDSSDSRDFGWMDRQSIIGKVLFVN